MGMSENNHIKPRNISTTRHWIQLFSLRADAADADEIDESIRSGVQLRGTNLWVLCFAILIASLGLNVNSTAVIIGAMLISPLMGPIVGVGYGLAIHDLPLILKSLRTLFAFGVISILTSTVYFSLSPLEQAGSELLLRTNPTLWDVLIAFFGGCAGIIAITRRNFSNVLPGVAIATALMPPLCTAGYSLAHAKWSWLGGSMYLFAINSVFIAYAALLFVKFILGIGYHIVDADLKVRADWLTRFTVVAMVVPSVYLAWRVVDGQRYLEHLQTAIDAEISGNNVVVLRRDINADNKRVDLTIAGDISAEQLTRKLQARMHGTRWSDSIFTVQSISRKSVDVDRMRTELQQDVQRASVLEIGKLRGQLETVQKQLQAVGQARQQDSSDILLQVQKELLVQYPKIRQLYIGIAAQNTSEPSAKQAAPKTTAKDDENTQASTLRRHILVQIKDTSALDQTERSKLEQWLQLRLQPDTVSVAYIPKAEIIHEQKTEETIP